ncbi:MAG: peptidoglycan-binding protein [Proteobacteria bacterium]|nr:peptidoglycan-binding protein [Pseudomonadota bacterium]
MARQSTFLAGTLAAPVLAAAVLAGWVAGAGAQTGEPMKLPPLPPAAQDNTSSGAQPAPQQAGPQQQPPASEQSSPAQQAAAAPQKDSPDRLPPLPLDHGGIRDVQSELIALGFNPGPADGELGPATMAAVQQYNESRGGNGPVPVDGRLLARLQQDAGPRLTPEQVAARSQPRHAAPPANPVAGMVQQFESNLRTLLNGGGY